jgi:MoCo/4Fe-4S cofactor protein with predicted Tat translocation signal
MTDGMHDHEAITKKSGGHTDGHSDPVSPGHADEHAEDLTLREHPLDLAAVRAKLQSSTGKQYWRTLEELSGDPHFEELLHREFPRQASEWDESVDRRDFLKLMAASLALAGISGCGRTPEEHIVPYVKQPEGMVPGRKPRGTPHENRRQSRSSLKPRRH